MTGGGFVGGEGRFANLALPEGDKAAYYQLTSKRIYTACFYS